jgi:DNA (cytosine-5)-methyltransferase 1
VDTHVHRIFVRLGLVESHGRKRDHDPFQEAVPEHMRQRLHVNLVHHGRAVCTTQRAKCGECVLVSFCGRGREAVGKDDERPVALDLFAGAGGMGRGFRDAGFRIGLAVESNRHAAQTYRLNNPGVPVVEAVINDKTTASKLRRHMPGVEKVATLLAGAPCQGYSAAGARNPQDPQNVLYKHVARLARQLKVETICLENVPGVRRVNGHGFLDKIVAALEAAGYAVAPHLLRACAFGVPQHRLRYFFLCRRGRRAKKIAAPKATHRAHDEGETTLPETPRLVDLFAKLPEIAEGTAAEYFVGADGTQHLNMSTMAHSTRVIRKIKKIKPGEGPISYRRLEPGEARTLIAGHRALPLHPKLHRTISVREAAVIQGFPPDHFFCGPRADQPLQVANAVPPPLAEAVARHLSEEMGYGGARRRKRSARSGFKRRSVLRN